MILKKWEVGLIIFELSKNIVEIVLFYLENHKIIKELLETIPERVLTRGVYTEETLKDRFFSVEDKAFHMALVPDTNVKLFELVTSFVFTIFTFKSSVPIPIEELNNAPININELNNIDILQRAR